MADPRKTAEGLIKGLSDKFGTRVTCAVLYGSAARNEYVRGLSDTNVMVLLDSIDTGTLADAAPIVGSWAKETGSAPLLIEVDDWPRAADVFAIELADMRDAHVLLSGDDCVAGHPLDMAHLRTQVEKELRGKLLQLQTGLILSIKSGAVGHLLENALPSFAAYARAIIRMHGETAPVRTAAAIEQGLRIVGADPAPMLKVWAEREQRRHVKVELRDPLVEGYHRAVELMTEHVDQLEKNG